MMKLPDFFEFEPLNRLRGRMGIARDVYGSFSTSVDPGRLTRDELDLLTSGEGIDVRFEELTVLSDGTLAYKDSRVLLYIRDVHVYGDRDREPRYHLSNCKTLQEMNAKRKFDRYVIATEVKGIFKLNIISNGNKRSERRKLPVCQNCLSSLRFDGFDLQKMARTTRQRIVNDFTPDRFFDLYPRSLHVKKPSYDAITAPVNVYTEDWPEVSNRVRSERGWKCEKCHRLLNGRLQKYLHVHHENGQRWDNRRTNLRVLCIGCHAEEPDHHHLKNDPNYAHYMRERPPVPR
jgi:hypothetical protein